MSKTLTLGALQEALLAFDEGLDGAPVYLVVNGAAYPITDVWILPHSNFGEPSISIGDVPR